MGRAIPFSLEERRLIQKYIEEGLKNSQISKLMNRNTSSIHTEVGRNEKPYDAEIAHKNSGLSRSFRITTEERIKNLEYQMEILMDLIKERKNGKND